MVLMIVFYRYYASFPCWIYAQGYALYNRFLAGQHLIVYQKLAEDHGREPVGESVPL
jgi:hypothetical protein